MGPTLTGHHGARLRCNPSIAERLFRGLSAKGAAQQQVSSLCGHAGVSWCGFDDRLRWYPAWTQGVEEVCRELLQEPDVESVNLGRQVAERRAVSQVRRSCSPRLEVALQPAMCAA